jgi:BirA family transcriptional regulator, biotin operon repressor / biotin---[acetyl-CoA-carboxylase] ligase
MRDVRNLAKEASTLQDSLHTNHVGKKVMWFRNLSSTQEYARRWIATNGILRSKGFVIISDSQRKGIGRNGNKWVSPRGGIWLSVILSSALHPSNCILFSYCASLAVSEAITACTGLNSKLKWPNDILIEGKKVSGILVDASINSDAIEDIIVGIGVNANVKPERIETNLKDQTYPVTSLQEKLGLSCDTLDLTRCILQSLDKHYMSMETQNSNSILDKWKERAEVLISKSVQISHGAHNYTARVTALDDDGSLMVMRDDNTLEKIVSSEYRIRVID